MNLIEVMKENKYDDDRFFSQYAQMSRSVEGLQGAGEWHILQKMLPDFTDKRVLDLGCGFGQGFEKNRQELSEGTDSSRTA